MIGFDLGRFDSAIIFVDWEEAASSLLNRSSPKVNFLLLFPDLAVVAGGGGERDFLMGLEERIGGKLLNPAATSFPVAFLEAFTAISFDSSIFWFFFFPIRFLVFCKSQMEFSTTTLLITLLVSLILYKKFSPKSISSQHTLILVFGNFEQSPRMMNHLSCLLGNGFTVDVVAYFTSTTTQMNSGAKAGVSFIPLKQPRKLHGSRLMYLARGVWR